ncbi:MAG TPA: prolipoprotein diacylglyceryl transferase [Patescibacteria group bacterium]|nr:prolipoprotein diacylglyceryl transferase [Patescibacteria group bacterium]
MKILFYVFSIPIHFFGVMIALGILGGLAVAYFEVKRKNLNVDKMLDIVIYSTISAVVTARLFYILFYDLSNYMNNPLDIFKIYEGGLSIHGGLLGAFAFAVFYVRKHKLNFFKYADALAPGIILGQGIGRVGCDVFGKVMSTSYAWGIERQGQLLHPAQVYEFLLDYLVFFFLWRKRKSVKYDGQLFIWYIILFSINRSVVELFRYNPSVAGWFSISHLLSVLFIAGAIIVMFVIRKKKIDINEAKIEDTSVHRMDWVKDILLTLVLVTVSLLVFYMIQS